MESPVREVTLKILAKDITETDYFDSRDCAITRAIERAGLEGRDYGDFIGIRTEGVTLLVVRPEFHDRVIRMYAYGDQYDKSVLHFIEGDDKEPLKPADFEYVLRYNINGSDEEGDKTRVLR